MISSGGAALRSLAIAPSAPSPARRSSRPTGRACWSRTRRGGGLGQRFALANARSGRLVSSRSTASRRRPGRRGHQPRLRARAWPRRRLRPARPRALHRRRSRRSVVAGRPARGLQCDAHDGAELERGRRLAPGRRRRRVVARWPLARADPVGRRARARPAGRRQRDAPRLPRRGQPIYSVAFTPDGRFISYHRQQGRAVAGAGRGWTRDSGSRPASRAPGHARAAMRLRTRTRTPRRSPSRWVIATATARASSARFPFDDHGDFSLAWLGDGSRLLYGGSTRDHSDLWAMRRTAADSAG